MRALVTTVAGTSSRFGASLGREALKCIYYEGAPKQTLLARLLDIAPLFDKTVVVGGFRFDELCDYLEVLQTEKGIDSIELVKNDRYADLASGWSLYLGLEALSGIEWDDVLFVEGDLFVDETTLCLLSKGSGDAVTICSEPIHADKSVVLYFDKGSHPHYEYSTEHGLLTINNPFKSVYSSGQAWRFGDFTRLMEISRSFALNGGNGTNLEIIGPYFEPLDESSVEVVAFSEWVNCNTLQDWRRAFKKIEEDGNVNR